MASSSTPADTSPPIVLSPARPSYAIWPWPTYAELDRCWYICTRCWSADLSLESHKRHCLTHKLENAFMTSKLLNFLEAASLCHEHWVSGSDPASKCYQERISSPPDLPTYRIAVLDNATSVYYLEGDGSFRELCVKASVIQRLRIQEEWGEVQRVLGGLADRAHVIDMLTDDDEVQDGDAEAVGSVQAANLKMEPVENDEDKVLANIYKAMEEMHESDEDGPAAGSFAEASEAEEGADQVQRTAQIITVEMVDKALTKALDKAARGQDWRGRRQRIGSTSRLQQALKAKIAGLKKKKKLSKKSKK